MRSGMVGPGSVTPTCHAQIAPEPGQKLSALPGVRAPVTPRGARCLLLGALDLGDQQVAVHLADHLERDALGAGHGAGAEVRAVPEVFGVHLMDHLLDPLYRSG